ncbi:MAG: sugar phosphate isomerase/epimerase family protein [Candidatus Methanofastidiosia archaeon]
MAAISVSTGCVITHDYIKIRDQLSSTSADAVEIIVYEPYNECMQAIPKIFNNFSKTVSALHSVKSIQTLLSTPGQESKGESLIQESIVLAHKLDAPLLIVHAWDGRFFNLDIDTICAAIVRSCLFAEDYGITLSFEALPSRFMHPATLMQHILESTPLATFTLDFEYASIYSMFDDLMQFAPRLSNIHLRDYDGKWIVDGKRSYLSPGSGKTDFKAQIKKIKAHGYDAYYTIEAPHPSLEKIEESIEFFRSLI